MSSRNTYLSPEERRSAGALYEALSLAKDMAARGEKDPAVIVRAVSEHISARPHTQIQYVEIVDPDDLEPVDRLEGPTILALAVFVGKTRLIDNILLTVG
jgi:pantoate--beta-alanine ligase